MTSLHLLRLGTGKWTLGTVAVDSEYFCLVECALKQARGTPAAGCQRLCHILLGQDCCHKCRSSLCGTKGQCYDLFQEHFPKALIAHSKLPRIVSIESLPFRCDLSGHRTDMFVDACYSTQEVISLNVASRSSLLLCFGGSLHG